jgi:hypothetical protein
MKFSGAIDFNAPALNYARNPNIAAGPVTLALADMFALVFYFTSAWLVLR